MFSCEIKQLKNNARNGDVVYVIKDFNVTIKKPCQPCDRKIHFRDHNEKGKMLTDFAEKLNSMIYNTWFNQHHRKLCTRRSSEDRMSHYTCKQTLYKLNKKLPTKQ